MRAVILAGGKGIRLKPYTTVIPKPLIPLEGLPITEILIKQLKYYGFRDIVLAVGYMSDMVKAYFGNGKKWQVKINYAQERIPQGTIGPLKNIKFTEEDILVLNSDILTDLNFADFMQYHKKHSSSMTIAIHKEEIRLGSGIVQENDARLVVGYLEKPTLHHNISMGIYAINKSALKYIPQGKKYDMPQLIKNLLLRHEKVFAYESKNYWIDIGSHDDYKVAMVELKKDRVLRRRLKSRFSSPS